MRAVVVLLIVSCLVVTGCGTVVPLPGQGGVVRGGWIWPTPAPFPVGALPVPLEVEEIPAVVRPDAEYGACPAALLSDVTISAGPDETEPIRYTLGDGRPIRIVWPVGFSARRTTLIEIVAPDGTVVAREGEVATGLGGGWLPGDEAFGVCLPEWGPRRVAAPS